jgi:predicted amidophosphoribosyltransferase
MISILALDRLVAPLFPARCPGCGRPAEPLCPACRARVARPFDAPPPAGVDRWVAPFAYEGALRELVAQSKYRGRHAALAWLGEQMATAWTSSGAGRPDVITWVPAAAARRRDRGIDHARVLARVVARHTGLRLVAALRRTDRGAQTERCLADRRRGPSVVARRPLAGAVLLVDDVATTGATLRVCAGSLRAAGAGAVFALTAARTPPRH